jgi:hypothetical protein
MLKRLAIYFLAFAVIFGVTLQVAGSALAAAGQPAISMVAMHMGSDCDQPAPPCNGMTPDCMGSMGCFVNTAAPAAPLAVSVPWQWSAVDYFSLCAMPVSVSIKPEHSPPIPHA